jgi:hypothetical protein
MRKAVWLLCEVKQQELCARLAKPLQPGDVRV